MAPAWVSDWVVKASGLVLWAASPAHSWQNRKQWINTELSSLKILRSDASLVPYRRSAGAHLSTTRRNKDSEGYKNELAIREGYIIAPFQKKKSFFHLISRLQHQHFKEKNIFISHSFFLCNCVHQKYLINYWSMFLSPPCFAKVGRVGCFGKPVSTQEKESRICIPKSVLNSTSVSHTLLSPLNVRRNTQFY